jgi:hypothetical protein
LKPNYGDEKNNIKISQTKTSDRHKIKSSKHSRNRQRKKRKHAEQTSFQLVDLYLHEFCVKQCLTFGFESAELSSPAGSVRCGLGFDNVIHCVANPSGSQEFFEIPEAVYFWKI